MDGWVENIEAIEVVERLDEGGGFGLGTTWRETRTMFGKKATEVMEVTEFEEGVRYATSAESHGSKYFSEIRIDPTDAGSRSASVANHRRRSPRSRMSRSDGYSWGPPARCSRRT